MTISFEKIKKIAIIGSGAVGNSIYQELKNIFGDYLDIDVGDSNPIRTGQKFFVKKVEIIESLATKKYDYIIMGFSANTNEYVRSRETLAKIFECPIVSAIEVFQSYPSIRGWPLLDPVVAVERKSVFDYISSRLSDSESRMQYWLYYQWVCQIAGAFPSEGTIEDQYFQDQLIKLSNKEVFIDCGAYIGDTLKSFLEKTNTIFEEYYAFEPDKTNFEQLVDYVSTTPSHVQSRVRVFNAAITASSGFVSFNSVESQISRQDPVSDNLVWGYSLSDIPFQVEPTFFKLDLEGGDLNALTGGIKKIIQWRPTLCVAIYHNPEDFLDIPLFLMGTLKNYDFYVRAHNRFGLDFVFYCVPRWE